MGRGEDIDRFLGCSKGRFGITKFGVAMSNLLVAASYMYYFTCGFEILTRFVESLERFFVFL